MRAIVNRRFIDGKVDRPLCRAMLRLLGVADIILTSSDGALNPPTKKPQIQDGICGFRFAN